MKQEIGSLFVVSGPSGVGKTTMVTEFLKKHKELLLIDRVVTYTTKHPRAREIDGFDYHFINQDEFESKIEDEFFLEWSGEYGACYGTPAYIIDKLSYGYSYILIIDRSGAQEILKVYPQSILILLEIESLADLSERLYKRNAESDEQIERRLVLAKKEIEQEVVSPLYHYKIINNNFENALKAFSELVLSKCAGKQSKK